MGDFFHQLYSVKRICEIRGEKAHIIIGGDDVSPASDFSKPIHQAVEDLKPLLELLIRGILIRNFAQSSLYNKKE